MTYTKYLDNPRRRGNVGDRDHFQHIENALKDVVPGPGEVIVGGADGVAPRSVMLVDAPRAARPVPARETLVSSMGPGHGWSRNSGNIDLMNFADTSDGVFAGQHISTWVKEGDPASQIHHTGLSMNLQDNLLRLYVKIEHPHDFIPALSIYAFSGSNYYIKIEPQFVSQPHVFLRDWQVWTIDFADSYGRTASGTEPDLTTIDRIQIRAPFPSAMNGTGATVTFRFGGMTTVPRHHAAFPDGVVSFTYDDGYISQYTHAMPILAEAGFRATAHLICDCVDRSANFMSLEQVKRLHELHGWEIGAHAHTLEHHDNPLGDLPADVLESDFAAQKSWFANHGLGTGDHHAWPLGVYNKTAIEIAQKYFTSARSINSRPNAQSLNIHHRERLHRLYAHPMDNTALNTLPTDAVDRAKANGAWLIFFGHKLDDAASGNLTAKTSEFQALVDYVATSGMPVLPTGEVLAKLAVPE